MRLLSRGKFPLFSLLVLLGLALVNFTVQISADPDYRTMTTDSGTFAYCGRVILDGGLLYRDCWDNKPPGVYYLNALAIRLVGASPGTSPFSVWLFQAVWLTLAIWAYFLILHRVWEHAVLAALGSLVFLLLFLYPDIFQGGNYTETYAVLPAILALGAFWAYRRSGQRRWLAALGLLFTAGFLLKPTYIAAVLASGSVIAYLDVRRRDYKTLVANLAVIAVAAAVPIFLVALVWVVQGSFYELWFAVFLHNFGYVRDGFTLRSLYGSARLFLINQPMAALTTLTGMAYGLFLYQHARSLFGFSRPPDGDASRFTPGRMDPEQSRLWWQAGLGLALLVDVIFAVAPGKFFGHYLQMLLPGMVASLLFLWVAMRRAVRQARLHAAHPPSTQAAALAAVLIVSLSGGLEIAAKEMPNPAKLRAFCLVSGAPCYTPNELEQYILDNSQPDESVLVWAGHPALNFVTQRRSPTRYIFLKHLFTPTPNDQNGWSEFLAELKADPPALIVTQPDSSMGLPYLQNPVEHLCDGCDPDIQKKIPELKSMLDTEYQESFRIWDWVIYERIP